MPDNSETHGQTLGIWKDIPDRSTLEIGVDPDDDVGFVARGWLVSSDSKELEWTNSDLRSGGPAEPEPELRKGMHYTARIALFFRGDTTAQVAAIIRAPNGEIFGRYKQKFPGHKREVVRVTLLLVCEA